MNAYTDLEALWTDYQFEIASYIGKRVRMHHGQDTVNDMVSSVYLRAIVATRNGNGAKSDPRGWLYQIARSVMWDAWRDKKGTVLIEWEAMREEASNLPPVEEQAAATLLAEQVKKAVSQLNDGQANVVTLRLEGYSNGEIAEILGSTESAVKGLSTRAYANLRERLQGVAA